MIRKFKKLLKDTSGNFAILTGVLSIPLFAAAGLAVDYSNYTNLRNTVQSALDASGLATGAEFIKGSQTPQALELYAENFFEANMPANVDKDQYEFKFNIVAAGNEENQSLDTRLEISAIVNYDTYFGNLVGTETLTEQILSIVSLGNRTIEVALVLDNSGSMVFEAGTDGGSVASNDKRRMTLLKTASTDLVEKIFTAVSNSSLNEPAQFSIVPFSGTVNVGAADHKNHQDGNDFLDTKGFASYHNENFDWANSYRTKSGENVRTEHNTAAILTKNNGSEQHLTRLDVFPMLDTQWEGCVEMRPWPHNTTDTYESNTSGFSSSGSEKLFVPYLVPDAPDDSYYDFFSDSRQRLVTVFEGNNRRFSTSYLTDFFDYDADQNRAFAVYQRDNEFGPGDSLGEINDNKINRTNWLWKYQAVQAFTNKPNFEKNLNRTDNRYFADFGPNAFCPDSTVLQLTDNKKTILDHLDSMEAHGSTNIQQGLTWGWRTLSAAKPFTKGRPLSEKNNLKILILLTDGANQQLTQNNANNTLYSAWGYQRDSNVLKHPISDQNTHGRLLEGTSGSDRTDTIFQSQYSINTTPDNREEFEDLMDLHTNQSCNNIKDDGISIYAIAFDVPSGGQVRSLLENCSGSGKINNVEVVQNVKFYHDVEGIELEDTFKEIAEGISNLRVSQ